MNEAGALPSSRVVLSRPSPVLRPPPTPSRLGATSRSTVIRTGCSQAAAPGAEEGLPSSRHHLPHVPRPLRREVPRRCTSRLFPSSMAFALLLRARLLLGPFRVGLTTRQASLDAAVRTVASPYRAFDAALRRRAFPPDAGSLLPGLLAATRTGLAPAGGGELADTPDHIASLTSSRTDRTCPLGTQYPNHPRRTRLTSCTITSTGSSSRRRSVNSLIRSRACCIAL